MKKILMFAAAAVMLGGMFTSCKGYDMKECEKLSDKIEDEDLKANDYEEMVGQLDGLLDYCQSQLDDIKDIEGRTERCDKFSDFDDSEEAEYCSKFYMVLTYAKENGDLKKEAKDAFKDLSAKSRYKKILRAYEKLQDKCRDN